MVEEEPTKKNHSRRALEDEYTWEELGELIADRIEKTEFLDLKKGYSRREFIKFFWKRKKVGLRFDWMMVARAYSIWRDLNRENDHFTVIVGPEGCQPKGSNVMMANGDWKKVEDIKLGDIVLSPQEDGTYEFSKVINLFKFYSKNIYNVCELNRQKKRLYSCSHNHEIPINIKQKVNYGKETTWTMKHFKAEDFYLKSKHILANTTTPTMFKVDKFMDRNNCEIEPYTLGVYLGDGSFSSLRKHNKYYKGEPRMSKEFYKNWKGKMIYVKPHLIKASKCSHKGFNLCRQLNITSASPEIMNKVSKFYKITKIYTRENNKAKLYRFSLNGKLSKLLSQHGLEGKGSGDKFIPREALFSDEEYRKELLAGLIDTDGYLARGISYSICTKSKQLAKDIEFLIFSLGGRATIRRIKKKIKSTGFVGRYYNISFYIGNMELPLALERKKRINNKLFYLSTNRKSIELKKKKGNIVYGFELDSPSHWYVTNNYIITKNSGKTTFEIQLMSFISPNCDLKDVVFDMPQYITKLSKVAKEYRVNKINKDDQSIGIDEAAISLFSRESLSKSNKVLAKSFFVQRFLNVHTLICIPHYWSLDTLIRNHRINTLIIIKKRGKYKAVTGKGIKILNKIGSKDRTKELIQLPIPYGMFFEGEFRKSFPKTMSKTEYERYKFRHIKNFLEDVKLEASAEIMVPVKRIEKDLGIPQQNLIDSIKSGELEGKRIGNNYFLSKKAYQKLVNV